MTEQEQREYLAALGDPRFRVYIDSHGGKPLTPDACDYEAARHETDAPEWTTYGPKTDAYLYQLAQACKIKRLYREWRAELS